MKQRILWFSLLFFVVGAIFLGNSQKSSTAEKERWEYRTYLTDSTFTPDLNKLGDEGWELVTFRETSSTTHYIFKRRK